MTITNTQVNQFVKRKGLFELTVLKVPADDWLTSLSWVSSQAINHKLWQSQTTDSEAKKEQDRVWSFRDL